MDKRSLLLIIIGLSLAMNSCKQKISVIRQSKDQDLLLQVSRMQDEQDDPASLTYAVRLIPNKKTMAGISGKAKTALNYSMDSCFYLMKGTTKVYSAIVQPITNGVSGSFEYMLSFEDKQLKSGKWNLVYQDRYINRKKYTVMLLN